MDKRDGGPEFYFHFNPCYHTKYDNMQMVSSAEIEETGKNMVVQATL